LWQLFHNGRAEKIEAQVDCAAEHREVDQKGDNDIWQESGVITQYPDTSERRKEATGKVHHEISFALQGHDSTSVRFIFKVSYLHPVRQSLGIQSFY
jgi:hypothetical protein